LLETVDSEWEEFLVIGNGVNQIQDELDFVKDRLQTCLVRVDGSKDELVLIKNRLRRWLMVGKRLEREKSF
jgi:hypothetical protein